MAAFFGIDEGRARGFIANGIACLPYLPDGSLDLHAVVSPLRYEDIVFIKHSTAELSLHIKAVGVVQSDFAEALAGEACVPVRWLWQGEKVPENLDEVDALCGADLYEEHNITVQREILDLLPADWRNLQHGPAG